MNIVEKLIQDRVNQLDADSKKLEQVRKLVAGITSSPDSRKDGYWDRCGVGILEDLEKILKGAS